MGLVKFIRVGEFSYSKMPDPSGRLLLAVLVRAFKDLNSEDASTALDAYLFLLDDGGSIGDWMDLADEYKPKKLLLELLRQGRLEHELS